MDLIDRQIEAYNKQDIEEFIDCYSDNIEVYMLESNKKLTDGKEQLKKVMKASFVSKPKAKTLVESRLTQNNLVIDVEAVSGHEDGKLIRSIAIYEITDDKISKLWFGGRTVEDVT
ncbi:MAG: hypothetical protein HeimC2_36170 [Candidatus Heimdallarchaeota archaeon LC_2]|nr:MAG: hypothetical protein HeimC2_36170 [Candidatus Heimdallarchaeota archaeon LC_2]